MYSRAMQLYPVTYSQELIHKYDVRGPRYTSYPTAAEFVDFDANEYEKNLAKISSKSLEPIALYVHIPFCHDICYYCACNKIVTKDKSKADEYLQYLHKEMQLLHQALGAKRRVSQLHLGGGTPTYLNDSQLTQLIFLLSTYFQICNDDTREYSIEIDPRTIDEGRLALLKGLGFNRISFGVQDFSPDVQEAVNRKNSYETVANLLKAAKDYEFSGVNLDFIYGLPKQTVISLSETLDKIVQLKPERIAFYNYAHLPERFSSQRAIERLDLPKAEDKIAMLNIITEKLVVAGYVYIGMDHFVLPEDELALAQQHGKLQRNFQGYSVQKSQDLIGLGVSAITCCDDFFAQNHKTLDQYYHALNTDKLAVGKGLNVNEDDKLRRSVIMMLMSNFKLEFNAWNERFKHDFKECFAKELQSLKPLQDDGLLIISEYEIEVLPLGRAMIRPICMVFDAYLGKSDNNKFSQAL